MDEYAFEIHVPDANNRDGWSCKDDTNKVLSNDEHDAGEKANAIAREKFGNTFRVRMLRLVKRHNNPDGEI